MLTDFGVIFNPPLKTENQRLLMLSGCVKKQTLAWNRINKFYSWIITCGL